MSHVERVLAFDCGAERLIGVVSLPARSGDAGALAGGVGVVIIVGGPQYRAGSHRQFVLLARGLADAGIPVLRFDYRGMGDGEGGLRNFEHVSADVGCAIDAFRAAVPGVDKVVLWGLCDGASAALLYCDATRDGRVGGLCLLNPWARSEVSLAQTHLKHYYLDRLRQREFWLKLLSGKVALGALRGLVSNLKLALAGGRASGGTAPASFQQRMARAWRDFDGPMLLLLSGEDYTAKEFLEHVNADPAWSGALAKTRLLQHTEPEADHTFSECRFNAVVERWTLALASQVASR